MPALAADPTIRRQVMAAAREILAHDPGAPIDRISRAAGVSRATFYRHFHSRASLLESVAHEPRPNARSRILSAAQEMLLRTSLDQLSMDQLARASEVSRGTLYRLFPGKPALLLALIETYSPFETIRTIVQDRADEPPEVVLPLIAKAVLGVAGEHLGLMRAIFLEATSGTPETLAGVRPTFDAAIGSLARYVVDQMAAGRIRPMHPMLAIQSFIGPIFFHLMTRPVLEELVEFPMDVTAATDELVGVTLAGLRP